MKMNFYDVRLSCASRFVVVGPSGSGKSSFILKILKFQKDIFKCEFTRVIYIYGQSEPEIDRLSNGVKIEKYGGIDNLQELIESINARENNLLILDDVINEVLDQRLISDLFTKISRHKNITVFFLMQNLYPKGKFLSNISRNSNYIVLMNNPRDISQIKTLDYQVYGKGSIFLQKCFEDATKNNPFGYLLLDFNQETPNNLRTRTNIFPTDQSHPVYVRKY